MCGCHGYPVSIQPTILPQECSVGISRLSYPCVIITHLPNRSPCTTWASSHCHIPVVSPNFSPGAPSAAWVSMCYFSPIFPTGLTWSARAYPCVIITRPFNGSYVSGVCIKPPPLSCPCVITPNFIMSIAQVFNSHHIPT